MTDDGFFRTGEPVMMLPDGQIKIVDRLKDMIIVSGFKVYPNEIEEIIVEHPKVREAAVIGRPVMATGEEVVAFVVPRERDLAEHDLRPFCRERLTGYKMPRAFIFRDALPKSNVGKILRRSSRKAFRRELLFWTGRPSYAPKRGCWRRRTRPKSRCISRMRRRNYGRRPRKNSAKSGCPPPVLGLRLGRRPGAGPLSAGPTRCRSSGRSVLDFAAGSGLVAIAAAKAGAASVVACDIDDFLRRRHAFSTREANGVESGNPRMENLIGRDERLGGGAGGRCLL